MLRPIKKLLERNAYLIAISFTIFITIISFVSIKGVNPIKVENSDKFGHFLAYFILGLSWLVAVKNKINWIYLTLLLIVYGIILEVFQGVLTTHRQADFYDILANSLGVILAAILYIRFNGTNNGI